MATGRGSGTILRPGDAEETLKASGLQRLLIMLGGEPLEGILVQSGASQPGEVVR